MPATLAFFEKQLPAYFEEIGDGPDKQSFVETNVKMVQAIKNYQEWLTAELGPKAIGAFAIGARAYQRMLADDDMVDLPLDRLEDVGVKELDRLTQSFRETAEAIDPQRPPGEVYKSLSADHPAADRLIPAITDGLEELRAFVLEHRLAPIPSEVRPQVRETPPYARATTFASMDVPGPFEAATQAYFYVTLPDPSWPAERQEQQLQFFSFPEISDISTHEAYPGHYVQFLNRRLNPDLVRSLYGSGANSEGWGLYCEQMMLEEGLHDGDPRYRLAQLHAALVRASRYLVGIRMHTKGMTLADAQTFFETNAFMTPQGARVEARRGTGDPGYLRYQLGKLMILKLRKDVKDKLGDEFDLGKFHETFIKQGGLPLKLIRRAMLGEDGPLL
jgi:uncharacterized protein (DUF885 family)